MREQLLKSYKILFQTENKIQRKSKIEWSRDVLLGKTHKKISENGEFQTVYLARYIANYLGSLKKNTRNTGISCKKKNQKTQEDNSLSNFILSVTRLIRFSDRCH